MIKTFFSVVPILLSVAGLKTTPSIALLYEAEFGAKFPGLRSTSAIYCETDHTDEVRYDFCDGNVLIVDNDNRYHIVNEILNKQESTRFNAVSGTLFLQNTDDLNLMPKQTNVSSIDSFSGKGDILNPNTESFKVEDLDKHLSLVFDGATLGPNYEIKNVLSYNQYALSCYVRNGYSESNCELCAGYTLMSYLINDNVEYRNIFANFPKRRTKSFYSPEESEIETYKKASDHNYVCKEEDLWFEQSYITMRQAALSILDDFVFDSGLNPGDQSRMLEIFAKKYDLTSFDSYEVFDYNAEMGGERFKNFINSNKPLLVGTTGGQHGNHVMTVYGYRYYSRTKKVLFWDNVEWRTILSVCDGNDKSYFDITQYFKNVVNVGGCIIEYVW